ncbi:MAG: LysR family transcriptional regulator [Pseudomonadales bacterium]
MDIELLKTFLEVYKTRHFGKAADNLYLTSAAVSARIKQLESHLGVTIFVRNRKNVLLTNEGERLLPHAETLIMNWNRTLQELSLESSKRTRLHIGATSGLWQFTLQQKLSELTQALPDLAIQAEGHSDTELVRKLSDRSLDIVLLYEPPQLPEFRSEKVGQLKLVMASTDPGASAHSALESGYVYVDWGTSFSMFHAKRFGEIPPPSLHVNLAAIAVSFLSQNSGATYLPQSLLEQTPFLYPVKGTPAFNRPIHATFREGNDQPELIARVIELIKGISI